MTFRSDRIIVNSGGVMKDVKPEQLAEIYRDIAEIVGMEKNVLIYSVFKGQQVSFPVHLFSADYLKSRIKSEYNGSNIKQLALNYGYSERWIREIVKKEAANK